jgi:hypothetical protein
VAAATRVFDSYAEARDAILELQAAGIKPRSISVLTRSPSDAEVLEQDTGASEDLEDASVHRGRLSQFVEWLGRVGSATVPSFGAVLGSGDLWQDVSLAGRGHGSITGALVGAGVPIDEAALLEEGVMSGRILIVVHGTYDPVAAQRVLEPR